MTKTIEVTIKIDLIVDEDEDDIEQTLKNKKGK